MRAKQDQKWNGYPVIKTLPALRSRHGNLTRSRKGKDTWHFRWRDNSHCVWIQLLIPASWKVASSSGRCMGENVICASLYSLGGFSTGDALRQIESYPCGASIKEHQLGPPMPSTDHIKHISYVMLSTRIWYCSVMLHAYHNVNISKNILRKFGKIKIFREQHKSQLHWRN
jgi:hypothetical protein